MHARKGPPAADGSIADPAACTEKPTQLEAPWNGPEQAGSREEYPSHVFAAQLEQQDKFKVQSAWKNDMLAVSDREARGQWPDRDHLLNR